MAKQTIDLLISRSEDEREYNVYQPSTDGEATMVTRIEFVEGSEPDPLLGAIIALCAAAREDPFETAISLAEYLYNDETEVDKVKEFIHTHLDDMRKAIEKMGKHEKKADVPKDKTITYGELLELIEKIFG